MYQNGITFEKIISLMIVGLFDFFV